MLIRVVHLAWVEWTTRIKEYKKGRPGIYRTCPFRIYSITPVAVYLVKTIGLIISGIFIWALLMPGAACMKNSSSLAVAIRPPQDSMLPAATDTAAIPRKTDTSALTWLALGDSYTIGQSVAIEDRYPMQAAKLLQTDHLTCQSPEIIATTGWTTDDLLNALVTTPPALSTQKPAQPYNIVTLLIGVNNQYQGRSQSEYRDQFTRLLRQSIALAGYKSSHVIVLSIPDYSVTPYAHGRNTALIAAQIDSFNLINYKLSQDYQVHYLDITTDSRMALNDGSLIASDGLHFSGKEYAVWAEKLEEIMKDILK